MTKSLFLKALPLLSLAAISLAAPRSFALGPIHPSFKDTFDPTVTEASMVNPVGGNGPTDCIACRTRVTPGMFTVPTPVAESKSYESAITGATKPVTKSPADTGTSGIIREDEAPKENKNEHKGDDI